MSGESFEQIRIMMGMYPDDPRGRHRIAERLAGELPTISAHYGERKAQIVAEWIKGEGFGVVEDRGGWLEVLRLSWLLLRRVKWREVNPKEVLRAVVWWMMGVRL